MDCGQTLHESRSNFIARVNKQDGVSLHVYVVGNAVLLGTRSDHQLNANGPSSIGLMIGHLCSCKTLQAYVSSVKCPTRVRSVDRSTRFVGLNTCVSA